jgi:hypothetical protein
VGSLLTFRTPDAGLPHARQALVRNSADIAGLEVELATIGLSSVKCARSPAGCRTPKPNAMR